ncbi:hypothetical protein ES703_123353 [subsurface metagenome]
MAEYPNCWIESYIPELTGDYSDWAIFSIFSPAEIHVYDRSGNHVGIDDSGVVIENQLGAICITPKGTEYKTIIIPNADESQQYTLEVKGTGSGTMEIKVLLPYESNRKKRYIEYPPVRVTRETWAKAIISPVIFKLEEEETPANPKSDSVRDNATVLLLRERIPIRNLIRERTIRPSTFPMLTQLIAANVNSISELGNNPKIRVTSEEAWQYAKTALSTYGITNPSRTVMPSSELYEALHRGLIDAVLVTGHPWPMMQGPHELGLKLLPWSDEAINAVIKQYSDVEAAVLPAGTYIGQAYDIPGYADTRMSSFMK